VSPDAGAAPASSDGGVPPSLDADGGVVPAPSAAPPPPPPPSEPVVPLLAPAAPPPARPDEGTRLSDVVVTAKKRVEKAQDVPLPITVAGNKQLVEKNVTTSTDIERLTPNLSGQVTGNRSSRPRWFIRGIGTNDPSINLESPIGVYQDEVIIQYVPLQNFLLFDLERVEILKGPQGTLWGKNTTGGALHFVSRRPSFDPSGYLRSTYGAYGNRIAEAGYGGPVLGDWLAARASFYYEQQDGWATNTRDGSKGPQLNDFASRLQLLANVTDNIDVLVIGRYRVLNTGAPPTYPIGVLPGGGIQAYPNAPIYTPPYGTTPVQGGDFQAAAPNGYPLTNWSNSATVNVHLGAYTLTSISAIDVARTQSLTFGYSSVAFDQTEAYTTTHSQQLSQELRVTSPKADRFNWIAGLQYFNWYFFNAAEAANFGPVASRKNYADNRIKQRDVSPAAFASAKVSLLDNLGITGGLRYTYDRKTIDTQRLTASGAGVTFRDQNNFYLPGSLTSPLTTADTISDKASWSQVTWDVTPEYRLTKDHLLFVRFAKGFRAGTFNPTIVPGQGGNAAYLPKANPEVLYDFELGAKTTWFDGRLTANLAAFYYLLNDIQLNVQTPNPMGLQNAQTSTIQNAAGGNIKGLELEVNALPIPGLHLGGGLGLLRARYTDFLTYQGTTPVDASGNYFYRTPQVSAVLSADYTVPVSKTQSIGVGTDWIYRSRIFHNAVVQNDPVQETGRYAIGNIEVRYNVGQRLTLQGYVRNVTDTKYKILSQVVAGGAYPTTLGIPRTYGVQLIAKF
jgi:iron complex outermembrane receptor protein